MQKEMYGSELQGTIFNIQRYSIHDGDGIRTIVFFKGCPLRCRWCSNPESQMRCSELMFSKGKCVQCESCVRACPLGLIRLDESATAIEDLSQCDKCGECVLHCPIHGIKFSGEQVTASQLIKEITKDEIFFFTSGGGVTISGGEPLYQPQFLFSLLAACQSRGIDTAIETCGAADEEIFTKVVDMADHILMDLKHVDDSKHIAWTGGSCQKPLANWKALAGSGKDSVCRVPVIPGFNDTVGEISDMARFAGSIGVKKVHLLAYHNFGQGKYDGLNRKYPMAGAQKIPEETMERFKEEMQNYVPFVQIGG